MSSDEYGLYDITGSRLPFTPSEQNGVAKISFFSLRVGSPKRKMRKSTIKIAKDGLGHFDEAGSSFFLLDPVK